MILQLTQERLKALFIYEPRTGRFIRRFTVANQRAGTIAGSLKKDGYRKIEIDRVKYSEHRLAWLYMKGEWPFPECDHKNGIRSDNRWTNLRAVNRSQNKMNAKIRSDSRNRFKGVKRETYGFFGARIWVDGRNIYLGCYPTEEEAHAAYKKAAKKYFGKFARAA